MELLCATSNKSKLDDYRRIAAKLTAPVDSDAAKHMLSTEYETQFSEDLLGADVTIIGLNDIGINDVEKNMIAEETGMSLYENAAIKARAAFNIFRRSVFADDSGTWFNGIGAPGVFTGRYADDHKNIKKCLEQTDTLYNPYGLYNMRGMTATTVICLIDNFGNEYFFSGSLEGHISNSITKEDYDKVDDTKPAWANVLYPHLKFYTERAKTEFTKKEFELAGPLGKPPITGFGEYSTELYDDICPRRIALLNMLCYIKEEGI